MKIGPALRMLMSPPLERKAAGWYRSVFVDLGKVAAQLARQLPQQARVLDIGGGDGELLNGLLALRPDVSLVMVDVAESVGKFLEPRYRDRVELKPQTFIAEHVAVTTQRYDAALVSDVLHHIPVAQRHAFLASVREAVNSNGTIFIKDLEPGHFISALSLYCDRYISGDRGVSLISMSGVRALASETFPAHVTTEIGLYDQDRPNYLLKLDFG